MARAHNIVRQHNGCPVFDGYARVQLEGRTALIEISKENAQRVVGFEVKRDGSRRERNTKNTTEIFLIMVTPQEVIERLVLNTFYLELESA